MLAAPARKSQLCVAKEVDLADPARKSSTSVVKKVHFGSSSLKVATFQHTCSIVRINQLALIS